MTQEDKELLLKYLCMALPYDIMVDYESNIYILNEIGPACKDMDYITVRIQDVERLMCAENVMIEDIKPYLRPMSSMSDEEKKEYDHRLECMFYDTMYDDAFAIDWLNAHHFDYRGLIDKGFAIEVNESNNPYKE